MELKTGHLLAGGRYRIERVLGQGGFGITYEAHDTRFKSRAKSVAIKEFFVKDFCNRENETNRMVVATQGKVELVERLRNKFIDEANALFELEHTNIVRVTDIFEENGTAYYVMEYVNGSSLSSIVEKNGRLGESEALGYIRQVADALRYVHSQNRLHLDVKPQNIMIDGNGKAVLIDFGVSKQYDEVKGENTSTLLGCTPGYAPIEQIGGEIVEFHAATDVYSLGATLYKLITGITPASANKRASSMKLKELAFPDDITPATRAAIDAAMRLYVENRPQSIGEFLALLECHSEQSEESPKNANKEILPPSGRQNDNSGKVKDESGKRDGVEDCPPALRGTSAAEGVNDSPSTDDGETVVGNSSGSCHPERSEPSVDARRGQSQGTYKHANKEILPPSGRQNDKGGEWKDESGKMRDESGELRGERKGLGGSSKKRWAIIIAVLVIGAAAALLGTLSGGGSDDTAAERERLAAIAEEQRIEAERLAAEQQRLEQERLAQEAAEQQRLERERKAKEEAERKAAAEAAEQKRKEEERKRQEAAQTRGTINGHDYVDLGLSVKWATCNVGASSPEGYGNYYAWGETTTKSSYTEENSTTYGKQMSSIAGNPTWDAARKNWGSPWRLPTEAEFQELIDNCTWEWATRNGHNGYKVTSKKNSNSIFLPAAGWRYGTSSYYQGSYGYYWSATPTESDADYAYGLYFDEGGRGTGWGSRGSGYGVRPVSQN